MIVEHPFPISLLEPADAAITDHHALLNQARVLQQKFPLIDAHNDLPWQLLSRPDMDVATTDLNQQQPKLHTDVSRLRAGSVGGVFWVVYADFRNGPELALPQAMEAFDVIYQMLEKYPDDLELALTANDVERIFRKGKVVSFIGVEGGRTIHNSLGILRMYYRMGARYMTLTHNATTEWADSATDAPQHYGLSAFGKEVIKEMNRLGMMVDLSHVSENVMHQVLEISRAPVIFSHSNAKALTNHPRNVPDAVLDLLPANNGLVMVAVAPHFSSQPMADWHLARDAYRDHMEQQHPHEPSKVSAALALWEKERPHPITPYTAVADHLDYMVKRVGIDHVGIGSDFDGVLFLPEGLEDVSRFVDLTAELLRRGYVEEELKKIFGDNLLRVMRDNEAVAKQIKQEQLQA